MSFNPAYHVLVDDGKFYAPGSRQHLEGMFQRIAATPTDKPLVMHFHGGLVNQAGGFDVARRLHPTYADTGAYPVFFVWRSGLSEVLGNNLSNIWKEKTFQRLLLHLIRFAVAKAREHTGTRGVLNPPGEDPVMKKLNNADIQEPFADTDLSGFDDQSLDGDDLPPEDAEALAEALRADDPLMDEVAALSSEGEAATNRGVAMGPPPATMMQPEVLARIRSAAKTSRANRSLGLDPATLFKAAKILARIVKRFITKRHHGVYATAVEELLREIYVDAAGQFVWKEMKGDTADAFLAGEDRAGRAFIEMLRAEWEAGRKRRIVLVGHSTGAVYICELLKHVERERMPADMVFDVVFLAAACTYDLLAETLKESGGRVRQLRSFGMSDELERADYLMPDSLLEKFGWLEPIKKIYPHSLLYLVSGVFESQTDMPLVGMQRFRAGVRPFDAAKIPSVAVIDSYLKPDERTCWSIASDFDGRRTSAKDHGEFDEDDSTLASLQHIIRQRL